MPFFIAPPPYNCLVQTHHLTTPPLPLLFFFSILSCSAVSRRKMQSSGGGNCDKIRHIVRIRQMLRRWRRKAACSSFSLSDSIVRVPSDVPAGHVAICVGSRCRRFIVRASYLNHPVFRSLLRQAEEEYGFANHGPLAIPCEESVFEEVLEMVSRRESSHAPPVTVADDFHRYCYVESLPLLPRFPEKSIC